MVLQYQAVLCCPVLMHKFDGTTPVLLLKHADDGTSLVLIRAYDGFRRYYLATKQYEKARSELQVLPAYPKPSTQAITFVVLNCTERLHLDSKQKKTASSFLVQKNVLKSSTAKPSTYKTSLSQDKTSAEKKKSGLKSLISGA